MDKNKFAIILIIICALCLLLGLFATVKKAKTQGLKSFSSVGNKIALINIEGVISSSEANSAPFSYEDFGAQGALEAIKNAQKDSSVKAVVIKINSPGGTVAASQNLYRAVLRLRAEKPVVAVMEDVAASGGYYVACASDRIVAQRGTLTGSIGVIFSIMDIHQFLGQKLAITNNVIKSGPYKDMGSGTKPMAAKERALFQGIVNDAYKQFVGDVEAARVNRNDTFPLDKRMLSKANLLKYADGRVFTGQQAYNLGFVDSLGDLEDAEQVAKTLAVEKFKLINDDLPLVLYNKTSPFKDLFSTFSQSANSEKSIMNNLFPKSMTHGKTLMYLWE